MNDDNILNPESSTGTDNDGIDRRRFLKCMAWVGTGVVFTSLAGGILKSEILGPLSPTGGVRGVAAKGAMEKGALNFVQISDSHIGFDKPANHDVLGTLRETIKRINALDPTPEFIIHTGDLSHLSKPAEFDTLDEILKSAKPRKVFFVPGEHDVLGDHGKLYHERYGKETRGGGWYSFDHHGTHFIGLVNVLDLKAGGLGYLGPEQLAWLRADLAGRSHSTPIVVFAHVPLWSVYPAWGWGTDDSAKALEYLRPFGSVAVLNGHIHQTMQKVEGNITFHTAMSTAFPQPAPGTAPGPGPKLVPAEKLRTLLGLTRVDFIEGQHALAVIDSPLAAADSPKPAPAAAAEVSIDNFTFNPQTLTVPVGATVTWTNRDDIPHTVASADQRFKSSPPLDTGEHFAHTFEQTGIYSYYCTIHPHMTGRITVQ